MPDMRLTLRPSSPSDLDDQLKLAGLALVAALAGALCLSLGGMAGPFAALCLLPLAACLWTSEPVPAAEGGVLSLLALAIAVFGRSSGLAGPVPPEWLSPLLSLAAVGGVMSLAGLGLLRVRKRLVAQAAALETERLALHRLLADQPGLMLMLDGDDRVRAAFGEAPPGLDADGLFRDGLASAAPGMQAEIAATVARARLAGSAETALSPPALLLRLRRNGGGRLVGHILDNTGEQGRAAALQAERDDALAASAAKSRFLADMSHELRTPLNAVMGFSDVMRNKLFGPLPDRYAEYAQLIHESGRHLLDLINDLLDVSKIEAAKYKLKLETLDAREPLAGALRLLRPGADEAGVHLRANLPATPLPARIDRRAVKQMVLNLVGNALKFTPRGGQVTVTLDAVDGQLELTVADTGVGIAPEDLERLGRPYEQAGDAASQARGTGLGLSLVKALAGLHGGAMHIESVLGEGAAFTVRLPVLEPAT